MELYQLDYVLHEPCEDQGWMYMVEIPGTARLSGVGRKSKRSAGRALYGG